MPLHCNTDMPMGDRALSKGSPLSRSNGALREGLGRLALAGYEQSPLPE